MKRIILFILGTVIAVGMIVHGIKKEDIAEVEVNATLLCLSCIGIG
jgi:hypothetical protein